MSEEFELSLEEVKIGLMINKLSLGELKIKYVKDYVAKDDEIKQLKTQLQQKENIIKTFVEDLDKTIEFCTNEANGTTNDKICRITIQYLKHLKQLLDKENTHE